MRILRLADETYVARLDGTGRLLESTDEALTRLVEGLGAGPLPLRSSVVAGEESFTLVRSVSVEEPGYPAALAQALLSEGYLACSEEEQAREPFSFHLPGAHDQRTHGRRGPGLELAPVQITGRIRHTREEVRAGHGRITDGPFHTQLEQQFFGRKLTEVEWARLTGAIDGSRLITEANHGFYGPDSFWINVENDHLAYPATMEILKSHGGTRLTSVDLTIKRGERTKALGVRIVDSVLHQARELGLDSIDIVGEGSRDAPQQGYYLWPQMGFDGPVPRQVADTMPLLPNGRPSWLSKVLATSEGRRWWKEHGVSVQLVFDLRPGSHSWRTYDEFRRRIERIEGVGNAS